MTKSRACLGTLFKPLLVQFCFALVALSRVAPSREVLVAVSNKNLLWDGMLGTFGSGIKVGG